MTTVTLAKGGTGQREVEANTITIPDLWHLAMYLKDTDGDRTEGKYREQHLQTWGDMVLETWHLCHDLRRHITEQG